MFKKKTVSRKNAYHLLEVHFRENHADDDGVDNAPEKSCFAAISLENIKLIFLRMQFVKGLLKENAEMFEDNVVGCFVRILSNSKKRSYQLHQVIGVSQSSGEPNLRLSNMEAEVPISELSDRYITEEELESKAQSLHRFLTKNKPVEAELEETPSGVSAEQKEKPPGCSDKTEAGEEEKEQKPVNQEPIVAGYEADHVEAPEGTSEEENVLMSQPNAVAEEPEPELTLMDTSVTEEQAELRAEEENNVANAVSEEPEPEPPLMSASTPLDDIHREAQARADYTRRIIRAACELSAAGLTFDEEDYVRFGGSNASAMHPNPARPNYLQEFSALMTNSVRAQAQQLQQQWAREQQQRQQLQQQWAREQQQQQQLQQQWAREQQQQQQLQQQWAREQQQQQQWAREQQQQQQADQALQQLQQWVEAYQQQQSSIGRGGVTTILGNNRASSSTTQGLQGTASEDPTTVIWLGADHRGYGRPARTNCSLFFSLICSTARIYCKTVMNAPETYGAVAKRSLQIYRFILWGSKPLIEFLNSISKESRQYSQGEVDAIMKKYVASNNLIDPTNKRRIMCDEKLEKLFKKKTVLRKNVYHLLEVHFRENHDDDVDNALALRN
nr:uncharacterized protein At5g08430-like [Ipomoea batatas]